MNFSVELSEKTFGPNRVHVPKDVESSVQREEIFRNPTAEKSAASTLPSGLIEAFEVGARGTDKTPKRPHKTSPGAKMATDHPKSPDDGACVDVRSPPMRPDHHQLFRPRRQRNPSDWADHQ